MKFVGPPILLCLLAVSVAEAGAPQSLTIFDQPSWRIVEQSPSGSMTSQGWSLVQDGSIKLSRSENSNNSYRLWEYSATGDFVAGVFPNPRLHAYSVTGGTWTYSATLYGWGVVFEDSGPILAETIFTPLPGDLALDESIDSADAAILFEQWGTDGGSSRADMTLDGIVDAADAGSLFEAWTGDSTSALPEPSLPIGAMALAGLCLLRSPRVVVPIGDC